MTAEYEDLRAGREEMPLSSAAAELVGVPTASEKLHLLDLIRARIMEPESMLS
jgi:hypothetical protein